MGVILIVEDEFIVRDIAEIMIREWGHETLTASDCDGALACLRSPGRIDAIFTDIHLKKSVFGGCEIAIQAIKSRPNLRVLYTTGNLVTEELQARFVEGARCLRKPYTDHQLQVEVEFMLAAPV